VQSTLTNISKSLTLLLSSDESNNSDGGREERGHGREDRQDKDNRKRLIKFAEELGKAINNLLKEAGLPNTLDLKDTIKAAKKGELYSPDTEKRDLLAGLTADQEKSSKAPDQAKLQEAANKVRLAAGQLQGFATQVEDDNAAAATALGPQVQILLTLVVGA
jgi:hypothetical protein